MTVVQVGALSSLFAAVFYFFGKSEEGPLNKVLDGFWIATLPVGYLCMLCLILVSIFGEGRGSGPLNFKEGGEILSCFRSKKVSILLPTPYPALFRGVLFGCYCYPCGNRFLGLSASSTTGKAIQS